MDLDEFLDCLDNFFLNKPDELLTQLEILVHPASGLQVRTLRDIINVGKSPEEAEKAWEQLGSGYNHEFFLLINIMTNAETVKPPPRPLLSLPPTTSFPTIKTIIIKKWNDLIGHIQSVSKCCSCTPVLT